MFPCIAMLAVTGLPRRNLYVPLCMGPPLRKYVKAGPDGGPSGIRTRNLPVMSRFLCQLR